MTARRWVHPVLVGLLLGALAACGGDDSTVQARPELTAALQKVDDALVDERHGATKDALKELKSLAREAKKAGTLSDAQASDILAAAAQLVTDLRNPPSAEPTGSTTPSESSPAASTPSPEEEEEANSDEKDKDKPEKSDDDPGNSEDAPGHEDD